MTEDDGQLSRNAALFDKSDPPKAKAIAAEEWNLVLLRRIAMHLTAVENLFEALVASNAPPQEGRSADPGAR